MMTNPKRTSNTPKTSPLKNLIEPPQQLWIHCSIDSWLHWPSSSPKQTMDQWINDPIPQACSRLEAWQVISAPHSTWIVAWSTPALSLSKDWTAPSSSPRADALEARMCTLAEWRPEVRVQK